MSLLKLRRYDSKKCDYIKNKVKAKFYVDFAKSIFDF